MDGYQNRTGFKITYAQQLRYNTFLAEAAHERGLAIAMKNDPDQVKDLADLYGFAITKNCFEWRWCHEMSPFVDQNKAVLAAEYAVRVPKDLNVAEAARMKEKLQEAAKRALPKLERLSVETDPS